jgi:prevent-host-death family protein
MVMKKKTPPSIAREASGPFTTDSGAVSHAIPAGRFKARCLALMDDVHDRGTEYVITKRGKAVAKLVPVRVEQRPLLGSMTGTVTFLGDIVSPLGEPWAALEDGVSRNRDK